MKSRIRSILEQLTQTREDLAALSDDIWLSIDHNNNEVLSEFVAFKQSYNDKVTAFDRLAEELSVLVQQFTDVKLVADPATPGKPDPSIDELKLYPTITLNESFTRQRPFGFRFGNQVFKNVRTWRGIYETLCHLLAKRDAVRFAALPNDPRFTSNRGNHYFSREKENLRSAMKLPHGLFGEINLNANQLRELIGLMLQAFEIDQSEITLYLRPNQDG